MAPDSAESALAGEVLPWLPAELELLDAVLSADSLAALSLLESLLEELLEELLDELLLGGGGGVELGVDGVWGVVGVLALGQPASIRQAPAIAASRANE